MRQGLWFGRLHMDLPAQNLPGTTEAAPYVIYRPARQTMPVVFASPHSGQAYPAQLVAEARLAPLALRRSEDSFVDELFAAAPAHGEKDEGAPGLRPHYHPDYYGAYVRDPDGNKLCCVCHRPG